MFHNIKMFYSQLQTQIVSGYDADYQAVLDYGTSQGWTLPSDTTKTKDNTMILALKSAGIWTKLDVFYMFSTDGDSNFARINWKSPGNYTITLLGNIPPTFTTNQGFTGNATNLAYLSTNFNPFTNGVNYTQNNASRYFWKRTAAGTGYFDGMNSGGALLNGIQAGSSQNQRINQTANANGAYAFGTGIGMKSIHRTSSTGVTLFIDTTATARTSTSSTSFNLPQLILRADNSYGSHTVGMYAMGASLVSENTNFYNTINTRMS